MKRPTTVSALLFGFALGCGESVTGPATRELALSVCATNSWVAYQNEGGPWTRLGGSDGGVFTVRATDRLTLAYTSTNSQSPVLYLYFIGADQAQGILGCVVPTQFEQQSLTGTVQGLTPSNYLQVSIGPAATWVRPSDNTFPFQYAAAGTHDLFATRHTEITPDDAYADRMIIRRATTHTSGAIPLLDFESSEAFLPAENVLSWTGPGGQVRVDLRGADGNIHVLQLFGVGVSSGTAVAWTIPLYAVPTDRQVAGDMHVLQLFSGDRRLTAYYQQPADMTPTFGPELLDPAFNRIGTTPSMQAVLPWQPEYDGHVTMELSQPGRTIVITATREHWVSGGASAPVAWRVLLPDLRAVNGAPSGFDIEAGAPFGWSVLASSRRWDVRSTIGAAGDVFRSATRYGTAGN